MQKRSLCGMSQDEILDLITPAGYGNSHSLTVARGFYRKRIINIPDIKGISKELKLFLCQNTDPGVFNPEDKRLSADGSVKYLFRSAGGKAFETVFLPGPKRNTVCVSTQSGCRMGCSFCETASYGFYGNLTAGEILNQVMSIPESAKIDHVVFMGMGEPMDNPDEVLKACNILTSEWGLALSPSNVTVSTVGITPAISSFLERSRCNLAVSLFSPFADERRKAVPAERKYPVHEIISLLRNYPVLKKRRISMAYVMIDGLNDTDAHLSELTSLLAGTGIRVNLLSYHSRTDDYLESSSDERMIHFKHSLVLSGISASIRKSRGADIAAACGLLASGIKIG